MKTSQLGMAYNKFRHQEALREANEEFFARARPYFDAIQKQHCTGIQGYHIENGNVIPIYTDEADKFIKEIYHHLDYLQESVMKAYGLPYVPSITKPAGY